MKDKKSKIEHVPPIDDWGIVYCAEPSCGKIIGYFPPDVDLKENDDLELYCFHCSKALIKGKKNVKD